MVGWDRGVAQELVQVQTHGERGQALHVRAVDELVSTNNVGLKWGGSGREIEHAKLEIYINQLRKRSPSKLVL